MGACICVVYLIQTKVDNVIELYLFACGLPLLGINSSVCVLLCLTSSTVCAVCVWVGVGVGVWVCVGVDVGGGVQCVHSCMCDLQNWQKWYKTRMHGDG